jgi:cytochrome c oxidase assembly protein subunit 15
MLIGRALLSGAAVSHPPCSRSLAATSEVLRCLRSATTTPSSPARTRHLLLGLLSRSRSTAATTAPGFFTTRLHSSATGTLRAHANLFDRSALLCQLRSSSAVSSASAAPASEATATTSTAEPLPRVSHPIVSQHLLFIAVLVFAIVVVGGLTRLTESGLSITEWDLVTGVLPPLTEEAWDVELAKYRETPEGRL